MKRRAIIADRRRGPAFSRRPIERCLAHPVRGDLPKVAPAILDRRAAIAPRHRGRRVNDTRTAGNRLGKNGADIRHVHIQARRKGRTDATTITDHQDRIADPHLAGPARLAFAFRFEDFLEEGDEALDITMENPDRDR